MRWARRALWGVLCAALLVGCASAARPTPMPATLPDDFALRYEWREGSLPPPYYYQWRLTLNPDGSGELALTPDYPGEGVPEWVEPFTVSEAERAALYTQLREQGLWAQPWPAPDDPPIGGSSETLSATAAGQSAQLPAHVEGDAPRAMLAAVRDLRPTDLWATLEQRHAEYMAAHE